MSCCCCPPAVSALFLLWARSGFSKSSVAGALTFFPPDPALYKFERYLDGENIDDNDDASNNNDKNNNNDGNNQQYGSESKEAEEEVELDGDMERTSIRTGVKPTTTATTNNESNNNNNPNVDDDDEMMDETPPMNPAQALSDRALKMRKRAKVRNVQDNENFKQGITYRFVPDPRLANPPGYSGSIEAVKIGPDPKTKSFVAALIYRLKEDRVDDTTKTIIYSHGNATDIGAMHFMQVIIAKGCKCNVVMYDYSGYGESGGVALEHNTYRDVSLVYDYTLEHVVRKKNEKNIILYGQSVGSGPSCYLSANKPNVGGLILHSPFMSGMRVLTPSRILGCLDIFPNINRIAKVNCPVMVIHGVMDAEVHFSHGKAMHDAVPDHLKRTPWWVKDRGHNDITEGRTKLLEYIQKLKHFLDNLDESPAVE